MILMLSGDSQITFEQLPLLNFIDDLKELVKCVFGVCGDFVNTCLDKPLIVMILACALGFGLFNLLKCMFSTSKIGR